VFLSDKAWNALTGLVETLADSHLGLYLDGNNTLIAIAVLIIMIVLVWLVLLKLKIPQTICHFAIIGVASLLCLPSITIINIAHRDIHNTLYCCGVDVEDDSMFQNRCPLEWPKLYWLIFAGLVLSGSFISFRVVGSSKKTTNKQTDKTDDDSKTETKQKINKPVYQTKQSKYSTLSYKDDDETSCTESETESESSYTETDV
jgi:hypothetical protein